MRKYSTLDTLEAQIPFGADDADCNNIGAFIDEMAYFVRHTTPSQLRTAPGWKHLKVSTDHHQLHTAVRYTEHIT